MAENAQRRKRAFRRPNGRGRSRGEFLKENVSNGKERNFNDDRRQNEGTLKWGRKDFEIFKNEFSDPHEILDTINSKRRILHELFERECSLIVKLLCLVTTELEHSARKTSLMSAFLNCSKSKVNFNSLFLKVHYKLHNLDRICLNSL